MSERELFVVHLRPLPGVDALRALRLALRVLLRSYGLQCTHVTALGGDPALLEQTRQGDVANASSHDCIDG